MCSILHYFLQVNTVPEDEEGEEEEMGVAETYSEYWPAKRKILLKIYLNFQNIIQITHFS